MARNQRCLVGMDIPRPLCRIVVGAIAYIGIETEFEMVVGIDESWQQEIPRQVNTTAYGGVRLCIHPVPPIELSLRKILDRLNAFAHDRDRTRRSLVRSNGIARLLKEKSSGRLRQHLPEPRETGRLA